MMGMCTFILMCIGLWVCGRVGISSRISGDADSKIGGLMSREKVVQGYSLVKGNEDESHFYY